MNFLVRPDDHGGSTISTETRIYANNRSTLRRFTIYWRIIHPGSDIIRRMWLRAIKQRAEGEVAAITLEPCKMAPKQALAFVRTNELTLESTRLPVPTLAGFSGTTINPSARIPLPS
jgi:hypothetical protein